MQQQSMYVRTIVLLKISKNILILIDRNPVPDYYNLTLELSRERTTRAWSVECTAVDKMNAVCPSDVDLRPDYRRGVETTHTLYISLSALSCPSDVAVGQHYVRRSLNEACPLFVCSRYQYFLSFSCVLFILLLLLSLIHI